MSINVVRRWRILVFTDAVGITAGYKAIWDGLCLKNGLPPKDITFQIRSAYSVFPKNQLLEWRKTRKQPGFSTTPSVQIKLAQWIMSAVKGYEPDLIICQDPSMLFMMNDDWTQATLDRLRGGVYLIDGIPWLVMLPITAVNTKTKKADIAKLNSGFTERTEWEATQNSDDDDEEPDDDDQDDLARMEWHEPILVPMGRAMIRFDIQKAGRLIQRIPR